jgi:hypothetical protein
MSITAAKILAESFNLIQPGTLLDYLLRLKPVIADGIRRWSDSWQKSCGRCAAPMVCCA